MTKQKCNCFDETLEKVKGHILDQVPENATEVNIDWQGRSWVVSGGEFSPVNPKISISYRGMKKDKTPKASLTKDQVTIMASHCCFCGRPYEKAKEQTND